MNIREVNAQVTTYLCTYFPGYQTGIEFTIS